MIQRIQSVYLFIAGILLVVSAMFPVAHIVPDGLGSTLAMNNLFLSDADGHIVESLPYTLIAILAVAVMLPLAAIFMFNNRRLQMRMCSFTEVFIIFWYSHAAYLVWNYMTPGADVRPNLGALLPLLAMMLVYMGRRAIKKDEDLIRSVDRIR